jgi:hypothetical protein
MRESTALKGRHLGCGLLASRGRPEAGVTLRSRQPYPPLPHSLIVTHELKARSLFL